MPPTRRQRPKAVGGPLSLIPAYIDSFSSVIAAGIERSAAMIDEGDRPPVDSPEYAQNLSHLVTPVTEPLSNHSMPFAINSVARDDCSTSQASPAIVNQPLAPQQSPRSPQDPATTPLVTSPLVFGLSNHNLQGVVTIESAPAPQRSKYTGKISTQVLAKSAEELFQDEDIRIRVMRFFCPLMSFAEDIPMPAAAYCPIVEKSIADPYVYAYFTSVNCLFPILSRSQFLAEYEAFYLTKQSTDAAFVCCYYMVLALGARGSMMSTAPTDLFRLAWELYNRVVSTPYLQSVQVLLLMALELINCNKDGQAIIAVGTAVRIAQSLGLHRGISAHKQPYERGFVEKEYHLRASIWWVCYCLDKKLSFEVGRPSAINDIECDVDPPGDMPPTPVSDLVSPEDEAFFGQLIRLCQLQSTIITQLFCKSVTEGEDTALVEEIGALDEMLLTWKENLPQALRFDDQLAGVHSQTKSMGCVLLHCMYYNAMLVIHRAALFDMAPLQPLQQSQPRLVAADVVCLNSARALARIVNDLASSPYSWPVIRSTIPYLLNVLFTLYIGVMRNPRQWTSDSDVALLNTLRHCFSKASDNHVAI
ncbi:hypothetical protein BO94DRAFT_626109 [Aspergillus sclerotioniger CBS 115572]|uniref:Xylanolytic transcriptional activator regulatory domain-containing protein n=1 Tax=Aspergillus sclerotioniger CBS 115572 TaxID=1450535 RepID=A0A317W316_9EURO|nr:hypothetical protein BO94DRAFT_626109 [Aspergillus sclerotioniger CBS 115572]PWY80309.1 hypothetical protein BO94DRAFT_626109 [Aspergillus sclerotioniger CBS 115572]